MSEFRRGDPAENSAVVRELDRLWDRAKSRLASRNIRLTRKLLARRTGVPETTLSDWYNRKSAPRDPDGLSKVAAVLAEWAGEPAPAARFWAGLMDVDRVARETARLQDRHDPTDGKRGTADSKIGRPLDKVADPLQLGVHRAIEADSPVAYLPALPTYIEREHDYRLRDVVKQVSSGHSRMVVLVGGSSCGKSRACWEALRRLPGNWRLWHPFDPTRPEGALAGIPHVGRKTVVWLDETQSYLNTPDSDLGERVAASLHSLLADDERAPVLIIGSLWQEHWDSLTRQG